MPREVVRWGAVAASVVLLACDGATVDGQRVGGAAGIGGACHDYVTPDGYTCCCGAPYCTKNRVGGCKRHPVPMLDRDATVSGTGGTTEAASGGTSGSVGSTARGSGGTTSTGGSEDTSADGSTTCPVFASLELRELPDGGVDAVSEEGPIHEDPSCPVAQMSVLDGTRCKLGFGCATMPLSPMPGCCLASGFCGARTPSMNGICDTSLASLVPPEGCLSYAVFHRYWLFTDIPPDPQQRCSP